MRILEVTERTPLLIQQLLAIWEKSVSATHLFLSDSEIKSIKEYVPQVLSEIPHLIVAENEGGFPLHLWVLKMDNWRCFLLLLRVEVTDWENASCGTALRIIQ